MERIDTIRKQLLQVIQQAEQQGVIIDRIRIQRNTADGSLSGLTLDYEEQVNSQDGSHSRDGEQ